MTSHFNWNIIKHFSSRNTLGFTLQDVKREFPEKNPRHVSRIIADMVAANMLCKISHGKYHIIPFQADPDTYVPDGLQVAKYYMLNKEYYIGYASAIKIHGLARNSAAREYVVTKNQMKSAIRRYMGITCQFIHHDAIRFFGYSNIWINQFEEAMVSDLERTIVDITTNPQYCGGIIEVGSVLFQAKDRTDHDKLFYYFSRNMNKTAKKRFLFLTDLLDMPWTNEHERLMEELGPGISLLDPVALDRGRTSSRFGLKINVDPIRIKERVLQ